MVEGFVKRTDRYLPFELCREVSGPYCGRATTRGTNGAEVFAEIKNVEKATYAAEHFNF